MLSKSIGRPVALQSSIRPGQAAKGLRRLTLDPEMDRHARAAIEAYADSCADETPWLADILRKRLDALSRSVERVGDQFDGLHNDQDGPIQLTHCEHTARRLITFARMCANAREDYSAAAWDHVMKSIDRMLIQMR
ncbi:peptidase [Caballeronia sp. M23-90]